MAKTKNKVFEATEKIIHVSENGEQLGESITTKIVKKINKADDFVQVYLEDIAAMFKITKYSELKVLMAIWKHASFNPQDEAKGNEIYLVKTLKTKIAEELDLAYSSVDNAVKSLERQDMLIRIGRATYILNPKYFFKGYLKDRVNVVNMVIEYHIGGNLESENKNSK